MNVAGLKKQHTNNDFLKALGNNLGLKRKCVGFSEERLAYEFGIELRQIGRIERDEINTGIAFVKIIADTLGLLLKNIARWNEIFP